MSRLNCKVWILTALVTDVMNAVNVQIAIPMYQPMLPPPPPPIYPMPIIAQIQYNIKYNPKSNQITTTTTKRPRAIAIGVPMPMAMPVPVGVPVPAVMAPPPIIMVPFPPPIPCSINNKNTQQKYRSSSEDSSESSSCDSDFIRRRRRRRYKKRKRYYGGFRRSRRSSDNENELVKPMLSYVAENGDVKFSAKISGDDVAEFLGKNDDKYQSVQVATGEDENKRPNVAVLSKNYGKRKRGQYKKILLRGGISDHILSDGKKELNFRPPGNKKISNLSVSFQISN